MKVRVRVRVKVRARVRVRVAMWSMSQMKRKVSLKEHVTFVEAQPATACTVASHSASSVVYPAVGAFVTSQARVIREV